MSAANVVPHMLAPEEVKVQTPPNNKTENDVKTSMKSVSVVEKDERSSSVEGDTRSSTVDTPRRQSTIEEKPEIDRTPLEGEQLEKTI